MANNKQQTQELDLVTGTLEIVQCLIIFFAKFTFILAVFLVKRAFHLVTERPLTHRDVKSKKKSKQDDSIGWQVKSGRDLNSRDYNSRLHTMIMGPTGYGKTNLMTILQQNAIKKGHSLIFFDPKASVETRNMFTEICKKQGRKVYYFNEFTKNACTFNPLREGNVSQISDRIMNACEWSESYYEKRAEEALKDTLGYLKSQGEVITLAKIIDRLKKNPNQKEIIGLIVQLQAANSSEFAKLVNDDTNLSLNFRKLREENACLYIGISSLGYSNTAVFFNRLFMDGLLFHCYESLKEEHKIKGTLSNKPMSVFFDELSSIITPKFIDLQNKCRGAGIEITYATQCPSDLSTQGKDLRDQIMENTENLFLFKHTVPEHTEYLSKMAGTVTTKKKTHVIEHGFKTGMGSIREVESLLVHPNILRDLRIGQCLFINKKLKTADIINIREHDRDFEPRKSIHEIMIERNEQRSKMEFVREEPKQRYEYEHKFYRSKRPADEPQRFHHFYL